MDRRNALKLMAVTPALALLPQAKVKEANQLRPAQVCLITLKKDPTGKKLLEPCKFIIVSPHDVFPTLETYTLNDKIIEQVHFWKTTGPRHPILEVGFDSEFAFFVLKGKSGPHIKRHLTPGHGITAVIGHDYQHSPTWDTVREFLPNFQPPTQKFPTSLFVDGRKSSYTFNCQI